MNTVQHSRERDPRERPVPKSLRALLENLIDYAGLFPPAALDMATAVHNYARYLDGEHSWMLARFVLPASRLSEFESARSLLPLDDRTSAIAGDRSAGVSPAVARASSPALGSGHDKEWGAAPFPEEEGAKRPSEDAKHDSGEWRLSALLGSDPPADIEQIAEFNLRNAGLARIDSVEPKVGSAAEIRAIAALLPADTAAYFEVAPECAPELLPVIRDVGARAKIRTGGVTPDAIPTTDAVAAFIAECARANVAFKATAGLHHPLRCVKSLTYEAGAPQGTMHGFLNLFLVAAQTHASHINDIPWQLDARIAVLAATGPLLEFGDDFAHLRVDFPQAQRPVTSGWIGSPLAPNGLCEARIPTARIKKARRDFAISFGSCSFEEPVADLQELNLL